MLYLRGYQQVFKEISKNSKFRGVARALTKLMIKTKEVQCMNLVEWRLFLT